MKPTLVMVALLAGLALGPVARAASLKVGQPAPDFQVETFDGRHLSLADFKGQVLILNFWATWCAPCRKELPTLDGYYRIRKDAGLAVMAVATQDSVPAAQLKPLAKVAAIPFVRRMKGPYRVLGGVPTNYVIDRAGILRYAKADAFDLDKLNDLLVPLLNEPAPEGAQPAPTPVADKTAR